MVSCSRLSAGHYAAILEATGATYPETYHGGNRIYPLVGSSLFPAIQKKNRLFA